MFSKISGNPRSVVPPTADDSQDSTASKAQDRDWTGCIELCGDKPSPMTTDVELLGSSGGINTSGISNAHLTLEQRAELANQALEQMNKNRTAADAAADAAALGPVPRGDLKLGALGGTLVGTVVTLPAPLVVLLTGTPSAATLALGAGLMVSVPVGGVIGAAVGAAVVTLRHHGYLC